ncbi:5'-nucleotidase [Escherichia coli]
MRPILIVPLRSIQPTCWSTKISLYNGYRLSLSQSSSGSEISIVNRIINSLLVEVVVMSRNSPDTGIRVLNTIRHDKLDITRSAFTAGGNRCRLP